MKKRDSVTDIEHCIVDAIESGDHEALDELNKAIDRFMK